MHWWLLTTLHISNNASVFHIWQIITYVLPDSLFKYLLFYLYNSVFIFSKYSALIFHGLDVVLSLSTIWITAIWVSAICWGCGEIWLHQVILIYQGIYDIPHNEGACPGAEVVPGTGLSTKIMSSSELQSKTGAWFTHSYHCLHECLAWF